MSKVIRIVAEMSINDGQDKEFERLVTEMVGKVVGNEPGTLDYGWYLSADGRTCTIVEAYQDGDALMTHMANIGALFQSLMENCQVTRVNVYGNAPDELIGMAQSMGGTVTPLWQGPGV